MDPNCSKCWSTSKVCSQVKKSLDFQMVVSYQMYPFMSFLQFGMIMIPYQILVLNIAQWTFTSWEFYYAFLTEAALTVCWIAFQKESWKNVLLLAYQSLGVVYGDLSISPLYVFKSTFAEDIHHSETNEEIFGTLSFVFWTLTLVPLFKYVFIVLRADDNGEGE